MIEVVHLSVAVLGLDEVGESLGLLDLLGVVVVAVVLGTDVLHLVDAAALGASLNGALLGQTEPDDDVGVGGRAGAASELLLAGGADQDGVLQGSLAAGVEGAHVEDVDALHLSEDFETLETGGLFEIGGDGAGLATGSDEVLLDLDLRQSLVGADLLLGRAGKGSSLLAGG